MDVLVNNAGLGLYSLFTAGRGRGEKLQTRRGGRGSIIKFVERVYKIVFRGNTRWRKGKEVLYLELV